MMESVDRVSFHWRGVGTALFDPPRRDSFAGTAAEAAGRIHGGILLKEDAVDLERHRTLVGNATEVVAAVAAAWTDVGAEAWLGYNNRDPFVLAGTVVTRWRSNAVARRKHPSDAEVESAS